jgi:hypothetical protein
MEKRVVSKSYSLRQIPNQVIEFTLKVLIMKVYNPLDPSLNWTHYPRFVLDKSPLSQLNPKKKIFETIQPGSLSPTYLG